MPNLIESIIDRHLPHQPGGYVCQKLEGGLGGGSYKVEPSAGDIPQNAVVVTVIQDPLQWWKIETERSFREAIRGDPEVLIPQLFDMGFNEVDGQKYAFLVRDYIDGKDLDTVFELELNGDNRNRDIKDLAADLGYRLAVLHRHKTSAYGFLGKTEVLPSPQWGNFILNQLSTESRLVEKLPPDKQIGSINSGKLASLIPKLHTMVGSRQSSLFSVDSPSLGHGDARFANFIAGSDEQNFWTIRGIIDLEEAVGGDPEIDIAYIENWLHCSLYKRDFYAQSRAFRNGYNRVRLISSGYPERRLIYHALLSITYLRTVFGFKTQEFLSVNPRNRGYVEKHAQILKSLADGNALEDIKVSSLV